MKAKIFTLTRYMIAVQPPQPPTAPAPAIRPTPPTPPRIDKAPFKSDEKISATDDKPAEKIIDKPAEKIVDKQADKPVEKTADKPVETPIEKPAPPNQTVTVIPPDAPIVNDGQSDYDRGQDVLRQFRDLDAATDEPQTSTEQPRPAVPKITQSDGHGTFYWLFTIIFVGIAAFVIVKKFLITDKPALTKSELFADTSAKLKAASEKVNPTPPPKSDDKGKHFEVRV